MFGFFFRTLKTLLSFKGKAVIIINDGVVGALIKMDKRVMIAGLIAFFESIELNEGEKKALCRAIKQNFNKTVASVINKKGDK